MATVLLTGCAGFIGAWTAQALIARGDTVIGVDNFNDYYDVKLKRDRLKTFCSKATFHEVDITDAAQVENLFKKYPIDQVCHLAAQAGVGYSLKNPLAYESANNLGTLTLLEACRKSKVTSFIYASSSSVYGGNTKIPFAESDPVDKPISIYAATKRYNELIAHTYHHLYGIHCTGLRLFTVYGPWGRPDMALFKFTKAILEGKPIDVYNKGKMKRDFTFISDIVTGVIAALDKNHAHEVFNLGNSKPVELEHFVTLIEKETGKKAVKNYLPLQPGDVLETYADLTKASAGLDYSPRIEIEEGIKRFVAWYKRWTGSDF